MARRDTIEGTPAQDEECLEWMCWGELPRWEDLENRELEGPAARWCMYGMLRGWIEVLEIEREDTHPLRVVQFSRTGLRALSAYERREGLGD